MGKGLLAAAEGLSAGAADTSFIEDIGDEAAAVTVIAVVDTSSISDEDASALKTLRAWAASDEVELRVKIRPVGHPDAEEFGATPKYVLQTTGAEDVEDGPPATETLFEGSMDSLGKTADDLRAALVPFTGDLPAVECDAPEADLAGSSEAEQEPTEPA